MANREDKTLPKLIIEKPNYRYAEEVEPRLRECKKFTHDDRACFARNLGRMVADVQRKHKINLARLFLEAFGKSSDSLYKKRKSLVTMPGEKAEPHKLRSQARDYLDVIDGLVPYSKSSVNDDQTCRQNLILLLVRGSSYENQLTIREAMSAGFRKELSTQLDKVTDKVQNNVPIDYMYEWLRNHSPNNGLELECAPYSKSSASVTIAEVYSTDNSLGKVLPLSVNLEGIDTNSDFELRKAIQLAVFSAYGDGPIEVLAGHDGYFELGDPYMEGPSFEIDIFDYLPKAESAWVEASGYFSYRTFVDLELRYSANCNQWQPHLFWRSTMDDSGEHLMHSEIHGAYPHFNRLLSVFDNPDEGMILYAILDEQVLKSGAFTLFYVAIHEWHDLYRTTFRGREMFANYFSSFAEEFMELTDKVNDEFLFRADDSADHHYTSVLHEDNEYRHVPAPSGSFAELILRNLAYAPSEERIDNLMLADAKKKYAAFKKLSIEREQEYQGAIKSF